MGVADRDLPRFEFHEWLWDLDGELGALAGVSRNDLPEFDYHLAWTEGETSEITARAVLERAGYIATGLLTYTKGET